MNVLSFDFNHILSDDKLDNLRKSKITTSLEFVQCNNDKIASIIGCNVSEIIQLKQKILSVNSSKPLVADKLYEKHLRSTIVIKTGIEQIDKCLGGGIHSRTIIELYGDPCSGKTQLALQLTASTSLLHEYPVTYLTTSNFNADRLLQLLLRFNTQVNYENILKRITVIHICDVHQLFEALYSLEASHSKLIVIDSLASLFLQLLGDSSNEAISLLNKVASELKRLSVQNSCVVLVVNHTSTWQAKMPSLGRYWSHVPNMRLHISNLQNGQYELRIVQNIYRLSQDHCSFMLT